MKWIKSEDGQTMVEYVLLIAFVAIITVGVFKKINDYLINNPDSFQNKYMDTYKKVLQGDNSSFSGQYKHFYIRR